MSPPIGTSRMGTIMPKPAKESCRRLNHFRAGAELPLVRHPIPARRAGVLTLAAAGGVLLMAGPAAAGPSTADVTVSPPTAVQGSGENLMFHVTNTAQSAITKIKLILPADSPIAEVYPLSADNWAPAITQQTLATPLATIHGGAPATETAKDITWTAMPGKALAPGQAADLGVAIGPLPTLSQLLFSIESTYADGHAAAPLPVSLTLTPAAAGPADPAHHPGTTGTDPDADLFARTVAEADQGPGFWSVAGWIVAALIAIGALVAVLRSRHRGEPDDDDEPSAPDEPDEQKAPVSAGAARVTSWSYRDGPDEE